MTVSGKKALRLRHGMELYSLKDGEKPDNCRLGFSTTFIADISSNLRHDNNITMIKNIHESNEKLIMAIEDPDGRRIQISQVLHKNEGQRLNQ